MAHLSGPQRVSRSRSPRWVQAGALLALALLGGLAGAAEDSYLGVIEAEAAKIDAEAAAAAKVTTGAPESPADAEQAQFERLLDKQSKGAYSIYKRLPDQTRIEVFRQYQGGATIEQVKKTVLNRFLNKR